MKTLGVALAGLIFFFVASPCLPQSQDAGSTPSSAPKAAAPADNSPSGTSSEKKKPKKVWTNEEVGSLSSPISVVGDAKSSPAAEEKKPVESSAGDSARQRQIEQYRNQIQQIRAQMDAIDKRIDQLKNFKGENSNPSGGININQGYNMVPLEDQVKQLEEKKRQFAAKIDDLELQARKNGIDSGDLR